jgi:hypothetical protein
MRMVLKVSATAIILSAVLMCSDPALAAGADQAGGAVGTDNSASAGGGAGMGSATTSAAGANASQSSDTGTPNSHVAAQSNSANEAPFASNAGTMAESANSTALSTSTYHQ